MKIIKYRQLNRDMQTSNKFKTRSKATDLKKILFVMLCYLGKQPLEIID